MTRTWPGPTCLDGVADAQFVHSGLYERTSGSVPDGALSNGSLSQAIATKPGGQYLVSCWLTSIPYQGSTIPNDFAVKWNGSALYSQSNWAPSAGTNLQFVVPATTDSTTLEFDFSNVPSAFGFDDVTVENAPAPVLQAVTMSGSLLTFTWSGVGNLSYQIQSAASLSNPDWTNLGDAVTSPAKSATISIPVTTASQQFYRVMLLPTP